jgi:hypothetical protein
MPTERAQTVAATCFVSHDATVGKMTGSSLILRLIVRLRLTAQVIPQHFSKSFQMNSIKC